MIVTILAPAVDALTAMPRDLEDRIATVIEERLATRPAEYGRPLRHTLKGYWKYRVGDYRIIYAIKGEAVTVHAIGHRRQVYKDFKP